LLAVVAEALTKTAQGLCKMVRLAALAEVVAGGIAAQPLVGLEQLGKETLEETIRLAQPLLMFLLAAAAKALLVDLTAGLILAQEALGLHLQLQALLYTGLVVVVVALKAAQ